jgi:succinate dehydrogenase/fumarate reductase flavoprotein subunit
LPVATGNEGAAELAPSGRDKKTIEMPRKKSAHPEKILTNVLRIRVTEAVFKRLEKIAKSSDTHSVGEAARKILSKEKITVFYKDTSLNAAMEELALVRKELKAIGININQITKAFNSDKREHSQIFYVRKISELYLKVDGKTDGLLILINKLAEKWLPE